MSTQRLVQLSFLKQQASYVNEKPYELWLDDSDHGILSATNCQFEEISSVPVTDARSSGLDYSLDQHGFVFWHLPLKVALTSAAIHSERGDQVVQEYLKTVIDQVRVGLEAESVICFDWRYRSSADCRSTANARSRFKALEPASVVHIDESYKGGLSRVREVLGDDTVEKYLQRGMQIKIINAWRPLVKEVKMKPLALCDTRSVHLPDVETVDKVHGDHIREGIYAYMNPNHNWHWLPGQTQDEVTIFVTWDSAQAGKVAGCLHGAASLIEEKNHSKKGPRESIEVRLVVVTRK